MKQNEQNAKTLERRRLRAGRLLLKGIPQAEVARRVDVSCPTVCEWNKRLMEGGLDALRRRPSGRPAALDDAMRGQLANALNGGAKLHGFAADLWTLPRIGQLIKRLFGLKYSDSQVSRILSAMGWFCHRSTVRVGAQSGQIVRKWRPKR